MMTMMMIDMFQRWKVLLKPRGVFFQIAALLKSVSRMKETGILERGPFSL